MSSLREHKSTGPSPKTNWGRNYFQKDAVFANSDDEERSIEVRHDRLRSQISRLERSNEEFIDVERQLLGERYDEPQYAVSDNGGRESPHYRQRIRSGVPQEYAAKQREYAGRETDLAFAEREQWHEEDSGIEGERGELFSVSSDCGSESDLHKELRLATSAAIQSQERLQIAEATIRKLEKKRRDLEHQVNCYKPKPYRQEMTFADRGAGKRIRSPTGKLKPALRVSKPWTTSCVDTTRESEDMDESGSIRATAAAVSRVLEESADVARHFRGALSIGGTKNASSPGHTLERSRAPFLIGGFSNVSSNQAVPVPIQNKHAAEVRRLQDEKKVLNEQYRALLRQRTDDTRHKSSNLRDCLFLIEEIEFRLLEMCGA